MGAAGRHPPLVFVYYPIVDNIRLSLFSWSAFSAKPTFVGLDNYRTAAGDPVFWHSLLNNTLFAVTSLVFQVGFSLVLAAVLEEFVHQRLRGILRTIYFIPAVISITVSGSCSRSSTTSHLCSRTRSGPCPSHAGRRAQGRLCSGHGKKVEDDRLRRDHQ